MKKPDRDRLDAYYRDAESWAKDREKGILASRRIAWIVASIAALIALCEALALYGIMPLKTVVPYTLLVDRQTGYVQALKPLEPDRIGGDSALTQSFLVQYVIAREGFDMATVQSDYRKVVLFSQGEARADYIAAIQASNPQSPLNQLRRTSVIETRVKSVSQLRANSALVRFETVRRDTGARPQPGQPWVAVVQYRYSDAPMSIEDRYINPLGFAVTRYRRNPEALPEAIATEPPVGAAATP